jgi:hypothetical protein
MIVNETWNKLLFIHASNRSQWKNLRVCHRIGSDEILKRQNRQKRKNNLHRLSYLS